MKTIVDLIHRIVTGKQHARMFFTPVFAAFFLVLVALPVWLALKVDAYFGLFLPLHHPWDYVVSLPLLGGGSLLWLWSVLHFAKAKGTPVPVSPPPSLVDTGPYRYVRNPMLSGVFLLLFGIAFLTGSPSLLFVFTPAFMGCSILEFKLIEEPELEKRLGETYLDYKKRTPLLIPKFFRRLTNRALKTKKSGGD
ncbi:MAG TPA: isoprenylcysteine carboxylmethyltransferase family protein [Syntrophales bacterium]|nr:isoprenylcysteine carboxylmethyltransferase family protein [Syntrophales bacterium]